MEKRALEPLLLLPFLLYAVAGAPCDTVACPSGFVPKPGASAIKCTGNPCLVRECCYGE